VRRTPNTRTQPFRQPDPNTGIVYSDNNDGWYIVPFNGVNLRVIASEGLGWDHVSVSLLSRCPTWTEMDHICRLFFRDDETVMQLHVPTRDHISFHEYCLHLWRPQQAEIPRPDAILVGPRT
jgi:hypothetical protein